MRGIAGIFALLLTASALLATSTPPPRDCTDQTVHGDEEDPELEDVDGDGKPDHCHGAPGDKGTCLMANGANGNTATVRCSISVNPNQSRVEICGASLKCGAGIQERICGDEDTHAWGGIDKQSGKAFVVCWNGGFATPFVCP